MSRVSYIQCDSCKTKDSEEFIEKGIKKGTRIDYIGEAVRQWIVAQGYVKLSSTRVCHCESCMAERQV